jgi:hypothetical protein
MHLSGHFDPRGSEAAHEKPGGPGGGDTGRRARGYSTTRPRGETIVRYLRQKNFPDPGRGELLRITQPVEKLVVGPVGGPRGSENETKTLPKRRIRPPSRAEKGARRVFQQAEPFHALGWIGE